MGSTTKRWIGNGLGTVITPMVEGGFALAWAFALMQMPVVMGANGSLGMTLLLATSHLMFVVTMADFGVRRLDESGAAIGESVRIGLLGGGLLALPIVALLIAVYAGPLSDLAGVPWLPILWIALAATALPAQIPIWLRGERPQLWPAWQRLPLVALFALPVVLVPLIPFPQDCECYGFMEGGMIAMPLMAAYYGTYLFGASITLALVSAASVRATPPT